MPSAFYVVVFSETFPIGHVIFCDDFVNFFVILNEFNTFLTWENLYIMVQCYFKLGTSILSFPNMFSSVLYLFYLLKYNVLRKNVIENLTIFSQVPIRNLKAIPKTGKIQ